MWGKLPCESDLELNHNTSLWQSEKNDMSFGEELLNTHFYWLLISAEIYACWQSQPCCWFLIGCRNQTTPMFVCTWRSPPHHCIGEWIFCFCIDRLRSDLSHFCCGTFQRIFCFSSKPARITHPPARQKNKERWKRKGREKAEGSVGDRSPRSSLSSSSALVGLMTPSTSKPAKLLTSLWMRLSWCGGHAIRRRSNTKKRGNVGRKQGRKEGRREAKPLQS